MLAARLLSVWCASRSSPWRMLHSALPQIAEKPTTTTAAAAAISQRGEIRRDAPFWHSDIGVDRSGSRLGWYLVARYRLLFRKPR